jgi:hypothetical protein
MSLIYVYLLGSNQQHTATTNNQHTNNCRYMDGIKGMKN